MNKLVEEIIKPIIENNRNINKIVGIYGGRFQPFGPHHFKTYKWSQQFHQKDARSSRVYKGTRGMDYDKNFNDPQIANHINEV